MLKTLSLSLFKQTADQYQLRLGNQQRTISADDLQTFIDKSQTYYANSINLKRLGCELFTWLNGQESWLSKTENTLLQIKAANELTPIAWELLHDETGFLCANEHRPFTPLRLVSDDSQAFATAQRPLRMLFMASSPEDVKPLLDFESEERLILEATRKSNLELVVEESGSLQGLKECVINTQERFDVVHLTGHADINADGVPVFLLENEQGQRQDAQADEIARVFSESGRFPRLLFLSGCKTGAAGENSLPSLAAALVENGVAAVLGWAKPVYDSVASFAAQKLYELLANGVNLGRAVAVTRQALYRHELEIQAQDSGYQPQWHLLRFYADQSNLIALVVKGRPLPHRPVRQEFLDKQAKVEVYPPELFIGWRVYSSFQFTVLKPSNFNLLQLQYLFKIIFVLYKN